MPTTTDAAADLLSLTGKIESALRERHHLERVHGLGPVARAAIEAGDTTAQFYTNVLWHLSAQQDSLSHTRDSTGTPPTLPGITLLSQARRVLQEIHQPTPAIRLASSAIVRASSGDALGPWVAQMRGRSFSQLPVYDSGVFAGLLTTNSIARWLAQHLDESGDAVIENARVRDVLPFTEGHEHVHFAGPETTAAEVVALLRNPRPPTAVMLTASGKAFGPPLGLLVSADLPEFVATLNF